jgi:hypothetical protein
MTRIGSLSLTPMKVIGFKRQTSGESTAGWDRMDGVSAETEPEDNCAIGDAGQQA